MKEDKYTKIPPNNQVCAIFHMREKCFTQILKAYCVEL